MHQNEHADRAEAKGLKYAFRGAEAIFEFLGPDASPVEQSVAEARADLCLSCPLNGPAKGWIQTVAKGVAVATKEYFRIKDNLKLETSLDRNLGICKACWCPIKLKVWMPIGHIIDNTAEEMLEDFHEDCWILKEMEASR